MPGPAAWQPLALATPDAEVQLWLVNRDWPPATPVQLSPAEEERARRFALPTLRRHYAFGQQHLRTLLGRCSGQNPEDLVFASEPHGRPTLVGHGPHFSWSHRGAWAVLACSSRAIGVDIENVGSFCIDTARVACHPHELVALAHAEDKAPLFAQMWATKEACLKADGRGLSVDPSTICTTDTHGQFHDLVSVPDAARWRVRRFGVSPTHVVALATSADTHCSVTWPRRASA